MKKAKKGVTFNHNPLLRSELPAWRSRFVLLCLLGGSVALVGRAAYLQGVNDQFLQAKGESRYARVLEVPATRGKITDRQGDVLAVSSPVKSIWAIPEDARLNPSQTRQLEVEWGQLQLEQSTWAAHARIEKLAREKLAMRPPLPGQIIAIEERP